MKNIFLFLSFFVSIQVHAIEFTYDLPRGEFIYKNHFQVEKKRVSQTVDLSTPGGASELKELRSKGYTCLRKSSTLYLCSYIESNPAVPPEMGDFLQKKFESFYISFSNFGVTPELVLDTSTEQEWMVRESAKINDVMVPFYKFVYYYNSKDMKIIFPVNEEQGIPLAGLLSKDQLSLTVIISKRANIAYVVSVILEH